MWESNFAVYKRIWKSNLLGSFVQPLLYLLGMGVGVGTLVDQSSSSVELLGGVEYFAFLAPALIATTAMIVVAQEAMWPVMDGFMWSNAYWAMAATPLRPSEVAAGVGLWHATRAAVSAIGVAAVLVLFPSTRSWGLVAAVPFAVLTGLAFALPISAWSASREHTDQSFPAIMRFGIIPMFLFAGAFYPVDQLPGWLQPVAYVTPLWHGVELCRGAVLGTLGVAAAAGAHRLSGRDRAGWLRRLPGHVHAAVATMTTATLRAATGGLRILPPELVAARRPQRMLERAVMVNRRTWLIIVSGFFEPLFYLFSIRIGFGDLVGDITVGGQSVPYAEFVAPALMASSAMNGAVYDSTMNVFHKLKHDRLYDTVLSTPMVPADVALGEIGWAVARGFIYSIAFLLSMWALGMVGSPWMVLSLPICVLIGFAFAAIGMACTTYMRSWADFEYVTAVTLPLFLFSATFYPLSSYGSWAWVVQLSPLYHGVALVRAVNLGQFEWAMLGHVAVLAGLALFGIVVAARRISALLLK